jgi:hypothetical protein
VAVLLREQKGLVATAVATMQEQEVEGGMVVEGAANLLLPTEQGVLEVLTLIFLLEHRVLMLRMG